MNSKISTLIFIIVFSATSTGANFTVNITSDLIDLIPGDGVCEATLSTNDCTLRAAIMETNALSSSDSINLPEGVFALNRT